MLKAHIINIPPSKRDTLNAINENSSICDSTSMMSTGRSSNSAASSESGYEHGHNPYHLRSSNSEHSKPRIKRKFADNSEDIYIFPVSAAVVNRGMSKNTTSKHRRKPYEVDSDYYDDSEEEEVVNRSNRKVSSSSASAANNDDDNIVHFHSAKTSPATIQWLLQHYEVAEGVSLPRHILYDHYMRHCQECNVEPANAASFGKLIRSVFYGLKTRRLGTRGNSKYHYYGIRMKADSPLNSASNEYADSTVDAVESLTCEPVNTRSKNSPCVIHSQPQQVIVPPASNFCAVTSTVSTPPRQTMFTIPHDMSVTQYNTFLAAAATVKIPLLELPPLHQFDSHFRMIGVTIDQVVHFMTMYKQQCEEILDLVKRLNFDSVPIVWREFWQHDEDFNYETALDDNRSKLSLNRTRLFTISTLPVVQNFVREMDVRLYQAFISVLIPNVLRPIPSAMVQHIRTFCKRLESQLVESMQGAPEDIINLKVDAVATLAHTLRRYTCLNHVAQTARAVLSNADQISQMLSDLNKIDFRSLHAQACWACSCNSELLSDIDSSFKSALEKRLDLEQWASWLNSIIDKILSSETHYPSSLEEFIDAGKRLMLKWSFYSSLIMRDLTLRSAVTFGSFHLMRLLYDEYVFYLIEQKICKITGQSVITVMSPMQKSFDYQSPSRLGNGFSEIQYDLTSNIGTVTVLPHIVDNKSIYAPNQDGNEISVPIFHGDQTTGVVGLSGNNMDDKVIEINIPNGVQQTGNAETAIADTLNVAIEEFFVTTGDVNENTLTK